MHPYSELDFFSFFALFFKRLFLGFPNGLASDELQLILLVGVAISGALVGTFLVLRRMTMLANALSHTILFGIVLAFLLLCRSFGPLDIPVLMISALLCGFLTTFCTTFLTRNLKLQEDASIGLIFTLFFALGILLVTLYTRNVHIGTELVMGNCDALQLSDLKLVYAILLGNVLLFAFLYRAFAVTTFDSYLSRVVGFSPLVLNYLLMVQTSLTSIVTFRAVGVLMLLAFLTAPVLIARTWTNRLGRLLLLSSLVASFAAAVGVALSRHLYTFLGIGLSTGGLIVCILVLLYIISLTFHTLRTRISA
ncbi:MAG: hypothetical protein S4CHLAM81_07500 [Chlamydiales bacterium]|nr:hypothetical protein [Chlamydiales bacterium]MCH9635533.1 hypothetical protein [Chlamydiales bacterium]MCH9703418.1 metal ABC transporter permease [Chlamydiota bacterium]